MEKIDKITPFTFEHFQEFIKKDTETKEKIVELAKKFHQMLVEKKKEMIDKLIAEKVLTEKDRKYFSHDDMAEFLNILHNRNHFSEKEKAVFLTNSTYILTKKEELNERFNKFNIIVDDVLNFDVYKYLNEKDKMAWRKETSYIG
jgi:hypothetical protein